VSAFSLVIWLLFLMRLRHTERFMRAQVWLLAKGLAHVGALLDFTLRATR
jgi:hypothetical protein